jgi:hypothetical protein
LQRDIVVDHRAEPADRVDGPGREFRVVAVKGDVDLEWCFGSATEWIGKVRGGRELLGGGSEVVRPALNDGGRRRRRESPRTAPGFSSALACTTSPSAVTTSAAATLSRARPYFLTFQPMPPVRVSPPTPTLLVSPEEIARPCGVKASAT